MALAKQKRKPDYFPVNPDGHQLSRAELRIRVRALDVETVLEFAEQVVLDARRMWSEFPLKHRRRMQKVLFPERLAYDGEASRTPVTCLCFRDLERSESDVDLLLSFQPGMKTFYRFMQISFLLEDILQRPVELVTIEALSPYLGPHILNETEDLLAAA